MLTLSDAGPASLSATYRNAPRSRGADTTSALWSRRRSDLVTPIGYFLDLGRAIASFDSVT